jgi:predicted metalloprotease
MKWQGRRQSGNVDDQRGRSGRRPLGGIGLGKGGLGILVIVLIISWLTGTNPLQFLQQTNFDQYSVPDQPTSVPINDEMSQFVKVVFADTEDVWNELMDGYREPTLVLFTDYVESACGQANSAVGPFYCSRDERVYIDLSFYEELRNRFDAPGDFAQAYVIAHEVGHHVQHLLGITDRVHAMRDRVSEEEYNQLSVKLELQADFLAGVWAHHARNKGYLEEGDIEEALTAASAIGDDRLQMQSRGYVTPDSFTHGTSEQRMRWFRKGFQSGDPSEGDTFSTENL